MGSHGQNYIALLTDIVLLLAVPVSVEHVVRHVARCVGAVTAGFAQRNSEYCDNWGCRLML